jgi:hypothetical protein
VGGLGHSEVWGIQRSGAFRGLGHSEVWGIQSSGAFRSLGHSKVWGIGGLGCKGSRAYGHQGVAGLESIAVGVRGIEGSRV